MKLATVATFAIFITSCNKNKCYQCETSTRTITMTVHYDNVPSMTDMQRREVTDTTYTTTTETLCDVTRDDKLRYEILGTSTNTKNNGKLKTHMGYQETTTDKSTTCH